MNRKASSLNVLKELDSKLDSLQRKMVTQHFEALYYQPSVDKWSALQICKHLQLSEYLSLKNLKYNIGRIDTRPSASIKNAISSKILGLALHSPLKFKSPIPTRYDHHPKTLTLSEIFDEWLLTRQELKMIIDKCREESFSKQLYKHPYAGYLSIWQMIAFFRDHFDHHHKQIHQRLRDWQISRSAE